MKMSLLVYVANTALHSLFLQYNIIIIIKLKVICFCSGHSVNIVLASHRKALVVSSSMARDLESLTNTGEVNVVLCRQGIW